MLLLYFVAGGLVLGLIAGGRVGALAAVRIKLWPVALGGLVFQLFLFSPPLVDVVGEAGPLLYVVSSAAVMVALLVNLRQPGFALIGLGAALNFVVIVANGGQMPAAPDAWASLAGAAQLPVEQFSNSAVAGMHTHFPYLGDNFVLPRPLPLANVFSIGDVAIGLGGAWFIVRTMRGTAPRDLRGVQPSGRAPALG